MGILRIRAAAKQIIIFGEQAFAEFIRGSVSTKPISITYSNGTGQTINTNQVLYTYLTPGTDGYIEVKSLTNQVLSGSGVLNLSMTHQPSATQSDQNVQFSYDSSPINITISYDSKPIAEQVIIDITNRSIYTFQTSDFTDNYADYDGDALAAIRIYGDVTGYKLSGVQYNAGDRIPINNIEAGLLSYQALDQNNYYEKDNTWTAEDVNGNISE